MTPEERWEELERRFPTGLYGSTPERIAAEEQRARTLHNVAAELRQLYSDHRAGTLDLQGVTAAVALVKLIAELEGVPE